MQIKNEEIITEIETMLRLTKPVMDEYKGK